MTGKAWGSLHCSGLKRAFFLRFACDTQDQGDTVFQHKCQNFALTVVIFFKQQTEKQAVLS